MINLRVASALALACGIMGVAANAETCVSNYWEKGGRLVQVGAKSFNEGMPDEFRTCGRLGCVGTVTLKGIVQKDGHLRNVSLTGNTYGAGGKPDTQRAEIFRRWFITAMRYQPPTLNGKPVCVSMAWQYKFE